MRGVPAQLRRGWRWVQPRLHLNPLRWAARTWIGISYSVLLVAVIRYVDGNPLLLLTLIVALHLCQRGLPSPPKYATSDWTPPPRAPADR